jgi:hypothetical protein
MNRTQHFWMCITECKYLLFYVSCLPTILCTIIASQLPIFSVYDGIGHWQFPFSDIAFTHCSTSLTTTQFSIFLHKLVYATDNCLTYGWLLIKATSRNHSNISLQVFCLVYWAGDQSYWTTCACERSKLCCFWCTVEKLQWIKDGAPSRALEASTVITVAMYQYLLKKVKHKSPLHEDEPNRGDIFPHIL